jgi:hypothetical protein
LEQVGDPVGHDDAFLALDGLLDAKLKGGLLALRYDAIFTAAILPNDHHLTLHSPLSAFRSPLQATRPPCFTSHFLVLTPRPLTLLPLTSTCVQPRAPLSSPRPPLPSPAHIDQAPNPTPDSEALRAPHSALRTRSLTLSGLDNPSKSLSSASLTNPSSALLGWPTILLPAPTPKRDWRNSCSLAVV